MDDAGFTFHSGRLQKKETRDNTNKTLIKKLRLPLTKCDRMGKALEKVRKNFRLLFQVHFHLPSHKKTDHTLPQVQ